MKSQEETEPCDEYDGCFFDTIMSRQTLAVSCLAIILELENFQRFARYVGDPIADELTEGQPRSQAAVPTEWTPAGIHPTPCDRARW